MAIPFLGMSTSAGGNLSSPRCKWHRSCALCLEAHSVIPFANFYVALKLRIRPARMGQPNQVCSPLPLEWKDQAACAAMGEGISQRLQLSLKDQTVVQREKWI